MEFGVKKFIKLLVLSMFISSLAFAGDGNDDEDQYTRDVINFDFYVGTNDIFKGAATGYKGEFSKFDTASYNGKNVNYDNISASYSGGQLNKLEFDFYVGKDKYSVHESGKIAQTDFYKENGYGGYYNPVRYDDRDVHIDISHGAPEIDGSLSPKVGFLLGCLFLMFSRKKQNLESTLTASAI